MFAKNRQVLADELDRWIAEGQIKPHYIGWRNRQMQMPVPTRIRNSIDSITREHAILESMFRDVVHMPKNLPSRHSLICEAKNHVLIYV